MIQLKSERATLEDRLCDSERATLENRLRDAFHRRRLAKKAGRLDSAKAANYAAEIKGLTKKLRAVKTRTTDKRRYALGGMLPPGKLGLVDDRLRIQPKYRLL